MVKPVPMAVSATGFLALRYLRPKRTFVSVITAISLTGVAVGVLMMIVVRAVMLGFDAEFRDTLLGSEPHLLLVMEEPAAAGGDWTALADSARARPGVLAAGGYAGGDLYARTEGGQGGFPVYGLDPANAGFMLEKIRPHLFEGALELGDDAFLISDFAARRLGAAAGDTIKVYESGAVNRAARKFQEALNEEDAERQRELRRDISLDSREVTISGVFAGERGGFHAYTTLATARELFHLDEGAVTGVMVELARPYEAADAGAALLAGRDGWTARTWLDEGEARLAAMRNEQIMMTILLWIIALVAAFSVMNTTITVTVQKRREIGVLTALGCRAGDIVGVFVKQAAVIGGLGALGGTSLSLLVLWLRNDIRGWIARLTSGEIHAIEGVFLSEIPAHLTAGGVLAAAVGSFLLCVAAAFLPAWIAGRMEPAAALRD
jgi:lipoprotein-releasing system permease protein